MTPTRAATLTLVCLSATAWAGVLAVGGLWAIFDFSKGFTGGLRWPIIILGLSSLAGAQLVFMVLVADRLFPSVGRRVGVWFVEMAVFLVFLSCFLSSGLLAY